jgi:hypothetical protein
MIWLPRVTGAASVVPTAAPAGIGIDQMFDWSCSTAYTARWPAASRVKAEHCDARPRHQRAVVVRPEPPVERIGHRMRGVRADDGFPLGLGRRPPVPQRFCHTLAVEQNER